MCRSFLLWAEHGGDAQPRTVVAESISCAVQSHQSVIQGKHKKRGGVLKREGDARSDGSFGVYSTAPAFGSEVVIWPTQPPPH